MHEIFLIDSLIGFWISFRDHAYDPQLHESRQNFIARILSQIQSEELLSAENKSDDQQHS